MSDNKPFFIRLNLPSGLEESLEGLAKEVLRSQPNNINLFAAEYYENQLRKRNIEQGLPENRDIFDYSILKSNSQLPYNDDEHLKAQPLEIENISGRNSPDHDANEIDLNDPEYTRAATKIQAGYRGSKARKDFKNGSDQRTSIQIQMPVQMQEDDDDNGHEDEEETFEDDGEEGEVGNEENNEAMDIDLDDPEVGAAATKIQAGYRGMITRKSMKAKPSAKPAEDDLVNSDQEQAATRIQAGYRGMKTRKGMKLRQHEEQGSLNADIDLEDPDIEQAATRIQAGYRGMKVRKSTKLKKKDSVDIDLNDPDVEQAATKIQAGYRGMKVRKSPRQMKKDDSYTDQFQVTDPDEEDRAATRIQAGYRGMKTRRNLRSKETPDQNEIDIDLEDPDVERAASKIQAGYKGFKTRKDLRIRRHHSTENEKEEAETEIIAAGTKEPEVGEVEETEFQTESGDQVEPDVDLTYPDAEMAATKIQAGYRGMKTRKQFKNDRARKSQEEIDIDLDDLEVQQAASRIQAGYKGMKTRRDLQNRSIDNIDIDLTDPDVERAATKIQAGYKGMRTRKQTKFVKGQEGTKDLEDEVDNYSETELAATRIQAGYRGHQARKDYSQRKEILDNRKKIPKSLDEFNRNIENDIIDIDLSDPNVEHAATKIQAGYKGMRTRKTLGKKETPSEPIEELYSHQIDEDEAATRIQAGFRGMKTRSNLPLVPDDVMDVTRDEIPKSDVDIDLTDPEVEKAATKIQAGYKGMRTRRGLNEAKTTIEDGVIEDGEKWCEMDEAATKIQSGYRGMRTRKDLRNRLGDKEEPHDDEDLEKSPSEGDLNHLQPSNELEQGEIDAVANADLVDQQPDDSANMDLNDPDLENAATRIQAGYRGMKVRQDQRVQLKQNPDDEIAVNTQDQEIEGAATKIQAGFRGMQARKNFKLNATPEPHKVVIEAEDEELDIDLEDPDVQNAASKIQAGYKGMKVRKGIRNSNPRHDNVHTIEHDEEDINNYDPDDEEMAVAATRIQAGFKGMKARKEMAGRRGRRVGMFGQYDREDDGNCSVQNEDELDLEISATHVSAAGAIPFDMHPSAQQGHESEDDSPKKKAKSGREDSAGSERMEETFINVGEESPSKLMRQESRLASSMDNSSTSLKKTRNPLPPIEIYHYQGSHNSQKVMVYLFERGIEFSNYHVDFQRNEQLSKWFLELNPKGQVPVMKFDNQVITDSTRIIHHLEAHVPTDLHHPLVPNSHETHLYQQYVYFTALLDQLPVNKVIQGLAFHPDASLVSGRGEPYDTPDVFEKIQQTNLHRSLVLRQAAEENDKAASDLRKRASEFDKETLPILKDREEFESILDQVDKVLEKMESQLTETMHLDDECEGWLLGSSFSAVDIALGVILNKLALLGLQSRYWQGTARRPHLEKFLLQIQKRQDFVKSVGSLGRANVEIPALDAAAVADNEVGAGKPDESASKSLQTRMQLLDSNSDSVEVWQELQNGLTEEEKAAKAEEETGEVEEEEGEVEWKSLF